MPHSRTTDFLSHRKKKRLETSNVSSKGYVYEVTQSQKIEYQWHEGEE